MDFNSLAVQAATSSLALNTLYEHFFPRVYNFIFARVKDRDVADDVTSDAFLKVFEHIEDFDPSRGAFSTWLFRIAQNTLASHYRTAARRQETPWDDFLNGVAAPSSGQPEAIVLQNEDKRALLAALDTLSDRERHIVEMRYFAGLPNVSIAVLLETTPSNVGVILHRALAKLRNVLEN